MLGFGHGEALFDRARPLIFALALVGLACGSHADDLTGGGAAGGSGGTSGSGGTGTGGTGTGGSGGSGGPAGSGGSGGVAGTGGTSVTDGGCGCVTRPVRWGSNGGRVAFTDASTLDVCRTFLHERTPTSPSPPVISCKQELGTCAGVGSASDVAQAIADADVQAAIRAAPVVYGEDTRPVDGAVFRIQIGDALIEVGTRCASTACKPVPPGVDILVSLLQTITKQELSRSPCKDAFPATF